LDAQYVKGIMTDGIALKRSREDGTDEAGPSKQIKLGDVPQQRPEGGVNYIEINGKTCTHAVAWPEDALEPDLSPPPPRKGPAAKEFPFTLDPFQRTAINCLEAGTHVIATSMHRRMRQSFCLERDQSLSIQRTNLC
jgi:ATP-dependent RNA helicase DOB1